MVQQMRTSPIQTDRILYQMCIDGGGLFKFTVGLPYDLLDFIEETGKQCIITLEPA